ncbi:VOC family protein [Microbacterium sp. 2FI]|uniref:VOC family protein n=1 Tax=Microbacterium sp. 2FI TaxID=2502193 RepID=UPI0010F6B548|nr:VOC family protein [Microbacterium sp. 2FI]
MAVLSLFPILSTRDLPRLVAFYERALGGRVDFRFEDAGEDVYVSLAVGAASLGIGRDAEAPDSAAGDRVALWFYVDDVDAHHTAFLDAGGSSVQPPADMPWGERVAQVRDPDGNLVNLGAQPAQPA